MESDILDPTPENIRRVRGPRSQQAFADQHDLGARTRVAEYESGKHTMDRARWELILLREGLHPTLRLTPR